MVQPRRIGIGGYFVQEQAATNPTFVGGTIYFADGSASQPLNSDASACSASQPANDHDHTASMNPDSLLAAYKRSSAGFYPVLMHDDSHDDDELVAAYHTNVRPAFGEALVVDTGAVKNLSGDLFIQRCAALAKKANKATTLEPLQRAITVEGVGSGGSSLTHRAVLPIALSPSEQGTFQTGVLQNSEVPGLLGLEGINSNRMLLDPTNLKAYFVGPGGYDIRLSPGSTVHRLVEAPTGHIMLPISNWPEAGQVSNPKKHVTFLSDVISQQASSNVSAVSSASETHASAPSHQVSYISCQDRKPLFCLQQHCQVQRVPK